MTVGKGRLWISVLVAAMVSAVLVACGGAGNAPTDQAAGLSSDTTEVNRDGVLRIGQLVQPTTWDPLGWGSAPAAYAFVRYPYDQLIEYGPDLEPRGMLAESWETAADGLSMTMHLRSDVSFQDGAPFDADVVVANLQRALAMPAYQAAMPTLLSVEAVDPSTVRVQFSTPTFNFDDQLAQDVRVSSMANPVMFDNPALKTAPAGTGPYRLESVSAAGAVFERIPEHWDSSSGLARRIEMQVVSDPNARLTGLQSGQLEMAYLTEDQLDAARQSGVGVVDLSGSVTSVGLMVDYQRPEMSDWRVRKAISLALDRQVIADVAFSGTCQPTQQMFTEFTGVAIPEADTPEALQPDLDRARALLAEAGVPNPQINIVTQGIVTYEKMAQLMQQQLAQIGITVNLHRQTTAEAAQAFAAGDWDGFTTGVTGAPESQALVQANLLARGKGFGMPDYLQAQAAEAERLPVGPERDAAYQAINQTLIDQPAHIPVCRNTPAIGTVATVVDADSNVDGRVNLGIIGARRMGVAAGTS